MDREWQYLDHAKGVLREHADGQHGRADDDPRTDRAGGTPDGHSHHDEQGAHRVVGDGMEPRRKKPNE
jgi:hypothetical protein